MPFGPFLDVLVEDLLALWAHLAVLPHFFLSGDFGIIVCLLLWGDASVESIGGIGLGMIQGNLGLSDLVKDCLPGLFTGLEGAYLKILLS